MTKSKTMIDDMIDGVKKAAAKVSEIGGKTAAGDEPNKLYERVVPIPQVDTYSELPFALVKKAGVEGKPGKSAKPTASFSKPKSKAKASSSSAKKSTKKSTKTTSKRKTKK